MRHDPGKSRKRYEIDLTPTAEAAYLSYLSRAEKAVERGDASNAHITTLNVLRDALRAIEEHPRDRRYALAGRLSSLYRIKKGRMRICWAVSEEQGRVCILFISETFRKEGAADDPYEVFTKMVMSGEFKQVFGKLGVHLPDGKGSPYRIQ